MGKILGSGPQKGPILGHFWTQIWTPELEGWDWVWPNLNVYTVDPRSGAVTGWPGRGPKGAQKGAQKGAKKGSF